MKKIFSYQYLLLIIVVLTAGFLRFWDLGKNPPSLTWDEVAWGYNAYSLGLDGRDEFGRFLPYDYLESFGDFKPPVYAYLDILPVKLFGLNEFAVRFPSAFFGVLTVLITYFLAKRIFSNSRYSFEYKKLKLGIPEMAALLLAISPWHINLSRAAFEANVASFLLVLGILLFLIGVQTKPKYIIFSAVAFALSLYTFNSVRIVTPIMVLILAIDFRKKLIEQKTETITAIIVGLLLLLPIVGFLFSPQAGLRFKEVNIFSDIEIINRTNQQIDNDGNTFLSKIIHNRRFAYGVEYLKHYFDNLSPDFLFIRGDGNPKFSTQDVGELYLFELPFLVFGMLFLIKNKEGKWWLLPLWLIIGIAPAATARETPHALRIETTLPTFQIITAYGVLVALKRISNIKYRILKIGISKIIYTMIISFSFFNILYYLYGYYVHYPYIYSREWQYGYKESIDYVQRIKNKYNNIYVTMNLGRPYIYYLFYTKTNPNDFRKTAEIKRDVFGFVTIEGFDKYKFVKDLNSNFTEKALFISTSGQTPQNVNILKKINTLDKIETLNIYSN